MPLALSAHLPGPGKQVVKLEGRGGPITDATLVSTDPKAYATNLDLFLQHGSTPAGDKPAKQMAPWGDSGTLTQQQIADVIAYVMSLNPAK